MVCQTRRTPDILGLTYKSSFKGRPGWDALF